MDGARPEFRTPAASAAGVAVSAARLVYPIISAENALIAALVEHTQKHGDQPVSAIRRAVKDAVVKKVAGGSFFKCRQKRSVITEFTFQSRMRLWMNIRNCGVLFLSMLTVTYPRDFPSDGPTTKRHLKAFLQWLRDNFYGIRGIWFLEFQKRGAPHYHILLDLDLESYGPLTTRRRRNVFASAPSYFTNIEMENAAAKAWYRIVGSGDPKHLKAGVSWERFEAIDAAERYAAKHAVKPRQKDVPKGFEKVGRFWGQLGGVRIQWEDEDFVGILAEDVFAEFDPEQVMSSKGKIRKYIVRKI